MTNQILQFLWILHMANLYNFMDIEEAQAQVWGNSIGNTWLHPLLYIMSDILKTVCDILSRWNIPAIKLFTVHKIQLVPATNLESLKEFLGLWDGVILSKQICASVSFTTIIHYGLNKLQIEIKSLTSLSPNIIGRTFNGLGEDQILQSKRQDGPKN